MNVMKLIREKAGNNSGMRAVTIAFLGDSVTQGCFEIYKTENETIETIYDKRSTYHGYLDRIFSYLYPSVPINIINAGISGGSAPHGLARLERDVLRHNPDLTIVCFGLNDSSVEGLDGISKYIEALREIFEKLKEANSEIIFMTPNMMNTYVSVDLKDADMCAIAENSKMTQNEGILEAYLVEAVKLCEKCGVKVCDCYSKWKRMAKNGVDTTKLLSNRINHPTRELNWLFAVSLLDTILDEI